MNSTQFITLSSNTQLHGNQFKLVKRISASVRDAIFFKTELLIFGIVCKTVLSLLSQFIVLSVV
jgi:hypothetical protein